MRTAPDRGLFVLAVLALAACTPLGPQTVLAGRPLYNEAVQRTSNEQMLLNLVRLRYRDTPFFLEVASVSSSYELEASASAGVGLQSGTSADWDLGLGARSMEVPTVTYTPLRGEDFVRQMMTPIDADTLLLLYHSGWSISRIVRVCLAGMNALPNAPGASGPTPAERPEFQRFQRAAQLLRQLQTADVVDLGRAEEGAWLQVRPEARGMPAWAELTDLLGLDPDRGRFRIVPGVGRPADGDELRILPRSLNSAFFYLSHAVHVPPADAAAGRVTVTRDPAGDVFDWADVTGDLLVVHSGAEAPQDAAVSTRYRGAWFWVADSDLGSKSTFSMLTQLFQLQGGGVPSQGPLLTLPVSR